MQEKKQGQPHHALSRLSPSHRHVTLPPAHTHTHTHHKQRSSTASKGEGTKIRMTVAYFCVSRTKTAANVNGVYKMDAQVHLTGT